MVKSAVKERKGPMGGKRREDGSGERREKGGGHSLA